MNREKQNELLNELNELEREVSEYNNSPTSITIDVLDPADDVIGFYDDGSDDIAEMFEGYHDVSTDWD